MNIKNISYCRLEIHECIEFADSNLNIEENSFIWKDRKIYREIYDDCKLLMQRVSQLTKMSIFTRSCNCF